MNDVEVTDGGSYTPTVAMNLNADGAHHVCNHNVFFNWNHVVCQHVQD
jgi:hypothetical protein